jgi:DNA-binding NtrC family response regulator
MLGGQRVCGFPVLRDQNDGLSLYPADTPANHDPTLSINPVNPVCGKTLVIVDDEKSYVDLLAQLLTENLSCPIAAFTRPVEALAALPELAVGMVVTDYYMPQLNGVEFIIRARQIWPTVPFIIITGHGVHFSPDDYTHVPELRTVLHKPFKWRVLAEEIVRYWGDSDSPFLKADATAR